MCTASALAALGQVSWNMLGILTRPGGGLLLTIKMSRCFSELHANTQCGQESTDMGVNDAESSLYYIWSGTHALQNPSFVANGPFLPSGLDQSRTYLLATAWA